MRTQAQDHDVVLVHDEHAYRQRFRRWHPVVANSVTVPRLVVPADDRVGYLGSVDKFPEIRRRRT